tara:strand:+ start:990 stop:1394 length:405 start_codon:yes stop_codon:yes gene_type:complete
MKVEHVPLEWVTRTWEGVKDYIASAVEFGKGDYTIDQIRGYVSQGHWDMLIAVDGGVIHGVATMHVYNRPNDRVALVTTAGGKMISNEGTFSQVKSYAASRGATVIECAARDSASRLFKRLGFEEKYRILGVKL